MHFPTLGIIHMNTFASSSDSVILSFASVSVIGQSNHFGFGFPTLTIESSSNQTSEHKNTQTKVMILKGLC